MNDQDVARLVAENVRLKAELGAATAQIADAWDEGRDSGYSDANWEERGVGPAPDDYNQPNPYRDGDA